MELKLYEHQKDMLKFSLNQSKCCYFADVGTGKTFPAILTFDLRRKKQMASKCLVVCPTSIMYNWERQINLITDLNAVVVYGSRKKRFELLDEDADVYIINYDYLRIAKKLLAQMGFDFLIVDELTYVKNHSTQRSKALRYISKHIPYRLGLTGSPITNSPMDAFGELYVIKPSVFGTNFYAFRGHYFHNVGTYFPNWVPRHDTVDNIANKLKECSIFVDKAECLDLPPVTYETRELEMSKRLKAYYNSMKHLLLVELEDGGISSASIILTKLLRLSQITSGFIKTDDGELTEIVPNPKLMELKDLVEGELSGKKVIVWAKFKHTIQQAQQMFESLNPAVLYGETQDKYGAIEKFQKDDSCRMFIGQLATGIGYDLTESDVMVYIEHDFSVTNRYQSLGRNNRIGQESNKLTVIDIVMADSIDTYTLSSLEKKQNVADRVYEILRN